ncbi:MAG: hypothetical protein HXX09_09040 [Bacteroidetes bacterium]|nr:hypothetical protein [Bacteroidota bacterium]
MRSNININLANTLQFTNNSLMEYLLKSMKKLFAFMILANLSIMAFGQTETVSINQKDSLKEITTDGIFDGVLISKMGYKINDFYIAQEDITNAQVDSFKGKRVIVIGKLKIVKGNQSGTIQNISEDRKYITEPKIRFYLYKEPAGFISH